ncbi:hypothetical protein KY345_00370, partial [Candidatus Woesearchaeota archaeon]|nr:hypothetical protein [Candidatus Woesearchaeota archaeon]
MDKKEGRMKLVRYFFIFIIMIGLSLEVSGAGDPRSVSREISLEDSVIFFSDSDGDGIKDSEDFDDDNDCICDTETRGAVGVPSSCGNSCSLCSDSTPPDACDEPPQNTEDCSGISYDCDANGNGVVDVDEDAIGAEQKLLGCFYKIGLGVGIDTSNPGYEPRVTINYALEPTSLEWYGSDSKAPDSAEPLSCYKNETLKFYSGYDCTQHNNDKTICLSKKDDKGCDYSDSLNRCYNKYTVLDLPNLADFKPPFTEFLGTDYYYDSDGNPLCPSAVSKEGQYWLFGKVIDQYDQEHDFKTTYYFPNVESADDSAEWSEKWYGGLYEWVEGEHYLYDVNWDEDYDDCLCLNYDKIVAIDKKIIVNRDCGDIEASADDVKGPTGHTTHAHCNDQNDERREYWCSVICNAADYSKSNFLYCTHQYQSGDVTSYYSSNLQGDITLKLYELEETLPADQSWGYLYVCSCIKETPKVWNMGGSSQGNCCGDDEGEETINSPIGDFDFDNSACCSTSGMCVFDNYCFSSWDASGDDKIAPENKMSVDDLYVCQQEGWVNPDKNGVVCKGIGKGAAYIQDDEKGGFCCGDDNMMFEDFEHGKPWSPYWDGEVSIVTDYYGDALQIKGKNTDREDGAYYDIGINEAGIYKIKAMVKSMSGDGIKFHIGIDGTDGRQTVQLPERTADSSWKEFEADITFNKGRARLALLIPGTSTAAIRVDNIRIIGKDDDFDSGLVGTVETDEGVISKLCIDCSFGNCPEGVEKYIWQQQPATQSFEIYTIDRDMIGGGRFDLVANGEEWFYCTAMQPNPTGNSIGNLGTFPMPGGETGYRKACDINRDGIYDELCVCPANQGCDDYDIPFDPMSLGEDCGCIGQPICSSGSNNCLDEDSDGTCDDCESSFGFGELCSTYTDQNCPSNECRLEGDNCMSLQSTTESVQKSDCTNRNSKACLGPPPQRSETYESTECTNQPRPGGAICNASRLCFGGENIWALDEGDRTPDCCMGGECKEKSDLTCNNIGGEICDEQLFDCIGEELTGLKDQDSGEICCVGKCTLIDDSVYGELSLYEHVNESFICYTEGGENVWAECCYGNDCMNGPLQDRQTPVDQVDKHTFTTGAMLHALRTYDKYEQDKNKYVDYVRVFSNVAEPKIVVSGLDAKRKSDWSGFNHLEFDIIYTNKPDKVEFVYTSGNSHKLNIMEYSVNGNGTYVWHHIKIPIEDINTGLIDQIKIHPVRLMSMALDNFFLTKSSDNRYCAGPFKRWIDALEPDPNIKYDTDRDGTIEDEDKIIYQRVCNAQLSMGWTGNKCCGNDNTKTSKEYYNDNYGACWAGFTVYDNERISDVINNDIGDYPKVIYKQPNYYYCNKDNYDSAQNNNRDIDYPANEIIGQLKIERKEHCDVEGGWFCSYDNDWWKKKLENEDGSTLTKPRNTTRNASNLFTNFAGDIREFGCCPIDMCWNGSLCVNSIEPTDIINYTFYNSNRESFSAEFGTGNVWGCMHNVTRNATGDIVSEDAYWKRLHYKERWDNFSQGYCNDNQCWTGAECVQPDWYTEKDSNETHTDITNLNVNDTETYTGSLRLPVGDRYCEAGEWSSRTKLLAIALINYSYNLPPPVDYTLFCDTYNNTLNNYP